MPQNLKSTVFVIVLMKAASLLAHDQHDAGHHTAAAAITERAQALVEAYRAHPVRQPPQKLLFDFDDEKRRSIDFLPLISHTHTGVTLGLMKDPPAFATHALLREMLSGEGYLNIQGPTVLIEHQVMAGNHIHSLWRDPQHDFGRDLLLEHLESEHALLKETIPSQTE